MSHNVDIYYDLARHDGWKPPFSQNDVFEFAKQGYNVKWTDYAGYSFAYIQFETAEEAVMFKLTHY